MGSYRSVVPTATVPLNPPITYNCPLRNAAEVADRPVGMDGAELQVSVSGSYTSSVVRLVAPSQPPAA